MYYSSVLDDSPRVIPLPSHQNLEYADNMARNDLIRNQQDETRREIFVTLIAQSSDSRWLYEQMSKAHSCNVKIMTSYHALDL